MNAKNYTLIAAGDMSSSFNSVGVNIEFFECYSLHCIWTGTPTGTLKLQVSNDSPNLQPTQIVNWSDYTGTTTNTGGAAGDFMYNVFPGAYTWVRLVFTRAAGTGTLLVNVTGKE